MRNCICVFSIAVALSTCQPGAAADYDQQVIAAKRFMFLERADKMEQSLVRPRTSLAKASRALLIREDRADNRERGQTYFSPEEAESLAKSSFAAVLEQAETDPLAEWVLARMYLFGLGTDLDKEAADRHFLSSANKGETASFLNIAYAMKEKRIKASGPDEITKWFKKGADAGDTRCMLAMADAMRDGEGVAEDFPGSLALIQKAASLGSPSAMCRLAALYGVFGESGPSRNMQYYWYEKAADSGSVTGMRNCGFLCFEGKISKINGGQPDLLLCFKWRKKAALSELPREYMLLAECYAFGTGCEQDLDAAKKWLAKGRAKANGDPSLMQLAVTVQSSIFSQGLTLFKPKAADAVDDK